MNRSVYAFALSLLSSSVFADSSLPRLNIDPGSITVSGFSAGADLAVQLHTAFSATFSGVGSFAGAPYWCAEGDWITGSTRCMTMTRSIDVSRSINKAKAEARAGRIDPLSNLSRSKVFIFTGSEDHIVEQPAGQKLAEYYNAFLDKTGIFFKGDLAAGHGLPTLSFGNPCGSMPSPPWAENCGYDGVGNMLRHLYGELKAPVQEAPSERIYWFSQSDFASSDALLARKGYVYIPKACLAGTERCRLHVALHGCLEGPDWTDTFRAHSGYNEWAEANNIVILYPAVTSSQFTNPMGCWDWWGYTDYDNYMNKNGPQMKAIKAMVDQIAGL